VLLYRLLCQSCPCRAQPYALSTFHLQCYATSHFWVVVPMNSHADPVSPVTSSNAESESVARPDRPCDTCRRRKSRCVFKPGSTTCILCEFHKQKCTFDEPSAPRAKRKNIPDATRDPKRRSLSDRPRGIEQPLTGRTNVHDYADLEGTSLLKTTRKYSTDS